MIIEIETTPGKAGDVGKALRAAGIMTMPVRRADFIKVDGDLNQVIAIVRTVDPEAKISSG